MIDITPTNVALVVLALSAWVLGLSLTVIGLAEITCRLSGRKD